MKKTQAIIALLLALSSTYISFSQTKLVEKVTKKGNELVIPYEKYILPNGLTLIIHEDHSDPVVHVDVTYHVGSAREEIGKSGFAHFFEHMMFQGSDHVGDEEHFKIITEAGGNMNGTTNRDRTNYFETVPSNQLERALWLEADRMGFLLDAVTQGKFEIQRATVKNERGQNYDNRPYGLGSEYVAKTLYPYGHPYSWLTIGYIEDLNRVNVNDLKNFFLRWYGPNNAALSIGGDVNPKEVIKLVEKYFSSIPTCPAVDKTIVPAVALSTDRYVSYEDNIRFPMLQMVFPTTPAFHKDEAALDVLAQILGGGKTSLFYKNFVKSQKALQAGAYNSTSELAGEFTMTVVALPNTPLNQMEKMIRSTFDEFEKRGVNDDDLAQFKANYEASTVRNLSSVSGKVSQLANYQALAGDAGLLTKELASIQAVTKEDVMRVYQQYIQGKKAVILSVYPKGKKELIASENNFVAQPENYQAPNYGYDGLKYVKAKDIFDRSKKPTTGVNPEMKLPNYWKEKLPNGIKIIGTNTNEIPAVTLSFTIKGGHFLSANDLSKVGIMPLTVAMMNEATNEHTAEQLSTSLQKLGSSVSFNSGLEGIYVQVNSLTKHLDATLAILAEKLLSPKFAQEDFDRLKKQQLEGIANQSTQPVAIADQVFDKILYGKESIQSYSMNGTAETLKNITLEDIKTFYQQYFSPSVTNLIIVGDITKNAIMPKLSFLTQWKAKEVKMPVINQDRKSLKTKIYLVDKENAAQSEIRIGYATNLPYSPVGEYYQTYVMNYILGGAFNSRLNLNLRENKGYTYGARSSFSNTKIAGSFTAQAGVKASTTDSSVVEFMKEIKNYAEQGITADELLFTKNSIGQSDALKYETPVQKASFLGLVLEYEQIDNFVEARKNTLKNLTQAKVNALAKQYLPYQNMVIVIVGDKKNIKSGLEKLGYEVVELDKSGVEI
ncbi:M16 family metallopeptidase [Arcicella lustrica]|uniref:Pitrilysin family protein n=1 Tax=Arcicella lustrica TaxID=2984196 RepID=A0ABU5SK31_9BACT|nr:pitrilysin family protein [Arcicella sp. DC25W]MEA5427657.1 pitrilysin family protein [Arcicella sp. DC25W]